ncbi:ZIP Zinc transporter [Planctomycetales bacterium 10988]|nr:ZIP Zinc transporter [Planctomycetales bacterium 10988]
MLTQSLLAALALSIVHLFGSRLRYLDAIPRARWLSIAGGVAVAYAILHLLPELQGYRDVLDRAGAEFALPIPGEHAVYLLTLLGLIIFYGLEKLAAKSKQQTPDGKPSGEVFWLHISSYTVYNALLGYLLVREDRSWQAAVLFCLGIGLHFVVNDYSLREHHQYRYHLVGRWLLAGAILLGWAVGVLTEIHEALTASVIAFLAGGILLNTFKEELPEEQESRFWFFALGAAAYAVILIVM